jgi:flagellar FliJ protein
MPRFRFRLRTLRRLREIHRDEQRSRLATAYEAERILAEQREANAAESLALAQAQRQLMQEASLDVNQLLTSQRYQLALEAQSRTLAEQAVKLAAEVERRRQAVVEADRDVRVLDKLEERQRRQHRENAERAQMKTLDEVAVTRWEAPEL